MGVEKLDHGKRSEKLALGRPINDFLDFLDISRTRDFDGLAGKLTFLTATRLFQQRIDHSDALKLTPGAPPLAYDDKSEIRLKSVAVNVLIELSF